MKHFRKYLFAIGIFSFCFTLMIPFHLESMNTIVEQQHDTEGIKGFLLENKQNTRFKPRQYIKMDYLYRDNLE